MQTFNKLVRDKIPEIIESNNETCETRILQDEEYIIELNKKLLEEANEVVSATNKEDTLEELADLYEVILAKLDTLQSNIDEIKEIAEAKTKKRGAFKKKIFLISTDKR